MGRGTANVSRGPGFLAAVGRGRGQGVSRGRGQSADQSSCLGSRQGGGQGVDRGSDLGSRQGGDQDSSQGVMAGVVKSRGRGVDQSRFLGSRHGGVQGVDRGSGLGSRQGSEKGRGRGFDQGSILGSSDTVGLQSDARQHTFTSSDHIEGSDGDDVSSFHVASMRRGSASQVQVPEPVNREWIYIENGEFSNQTSCTRRIGVNLKSMWSGPWESWKDVPNEDKKRLFERFQCYFQWEEKWDAEIFTCWERCIAGKIPDMLTRVRDAAKATARWKCLHVGDDMSVLVEFKPPWIKMDIWKQMIDFWNTPEWKAKSQRNQSNRSRSKGGKHTLGSQTYVTAKKKVVKIIGREPSHSEMWKQTHLRKGSRPFDKDLGSSSSVVEDIDLEDVDLEDFELQGTAQEKRSVWVDDRAHETLAKYEGYLVEKYGKEDSQHPKFDQDLWYQAVGGKNRGKVYGLSNISHQYLHGRQDHEIEKLNAIIQDVVKEKEEEKERLNGIIAELVMEKEKDKAEKEAMNERMANIEAMLKVRFQNV